eukprot:332666-Chlamydomonas_euryale.AAC.4
MTVARRGTVRVALLCGALFKEKLIISSRQSGQKGRWKGSFRVKVWTHARAPTSHSFTVESAPPLRTAEHAGVVGDVTLWHSSGQRQNAEGGGSGGRVADVKFACSARLDSLNLHQHASPTQLTPPCLTHSTCHAMLHPLNLPHNASPTTSSPRTASPTTSSPHTASPTTSSRQCFTHNI